MTTGRSTGLLLLFVMLTVPLSAMAKPVVIAHRGASGYLPEHTLLAVTAAHAMGADFIEQDVVLSKDGVPVVLHDIHLETTTDVAARFPERARADNRWYAIDFSLAELQSLSVSERRQSAGAPVFPERFPQQELGLRIPTLDEEIRLIAGLNRSTGRSAGLYIELKAPAFHTQAGHDIAAAVLEVLGRHGLNTADAKVLLQCFDPNTLMRLHTEKLTPLPLIQLIGAKDWDADDPVDYDAMRTAEGLVEVARYADGIGPWIPHLFDGDGLTSLTERAHALGLVVHPYTLRRDALPEDVSDLDALHRRVFIDASADGAFSDFPDLTRLFIDQQFPSSQPAVNKEHAP